MFEFRAIRAAAVVAAVAAFNSPAAQANPSTPMPVIESDAVDFCSLIGHNPTPQGVNDAFAAMGARPLDDVDIAMVMITAVHHVCPQHKDLIMGVAEPMAADEICGKPT